MGTSGRKLTLTGMVAAGTITVLGIATGNGGAAVLGTLGVAILALVLIWSGGAEKEDYRAATALASGARNHGGCLTAFVLVWIAFELYGLVSSIVAPFPNSLVNWNALARYGDLPVVLHVSLSVGLALCRVGCLVGLWVWWRKWCVVGFLSAAGLEVFMEAVGRAVLGPPPTSLQSPNVDLQATAVLLLITMYVAFVVLVWREWAQFE
jgi:hypothetical protein